MHKLRHPSNPNAIRGLICVALAAEQGAPLMHRLDCVLLVALGLQSGGLGFTVFLGILLIISASQEIQAAKSSRF